MELVGFCNQFMVFKDGLEASNSLKKEISEGHPLPDIIFVDLNMPVMDGWQFLDEMETVLHGGGTVIYVVSSSIDPKDMIRLRDHKFIHGHIGKPITIEKIKELALSLQ